MQILMYRRLVVKILRPLSPNCWNYRQARPCLAYIQSNFRKIMCYVCKLSTFSKTYFTYEHIHSHLMEDKTKHNLNILI